MICQRTIGIQARGHGRRGSWRVGSEYRRAGSGRRVPRESRRIERSGSKQWGGCEMRDSNTVAIIMVQDKVW